jgi:hypothetical protein
VAYTQGLHIAAGVGAVLAVLLAALVARVLRRAAGPADAGDARPETSPPAPVAADALCAN